MRSEASSASALRAFAARLLWHRLPRPAAYLAAAALAGTLPMLVRRCYFACFSGKADAYCVGEWLINYGGGFVRRGLGGAAIFAASDALGVEPRTILFVLLITCYALTLVALGVALLRARPITVLDVLVAVSPFAALFPVLHPVAGERKEVLLLAMTAVAYLTRLGVLDGPAKYLFWSLALAVLTAVDDAAVFFLPLFVLYLRVLTPARHAIGHRAALLGLPALAIFVAGYLSSSHVDLQGLCAAIERHQPGAWCAASAATRFASGWLTGTALEGVRSVMGRYTLLGGLLTILIGLAGLAPVWLALSRHAPSVRAAVRDMQMPALFVAACLAGIVALFVVASDWNRWFYIATSMLTMTYFAAESVDRVSGLDPDTGARDAVRCPVTTPPLHGIREP